MKVLIIADPSRVDRLARPLEAAGVEVALSLALGTSKLDRLRWSRQVMRDARAGQDVIISDMAGPIALEGAHAARRAGCPFVMRWRGDLWQEWDDPLHSRRMFGLKSVWGKWVLNNIVAKSDLLVPVSHSLSRSIVAATGCDQVKIVTVPIPVDTETFAPGDGTEARKRLGLEREHTITLVMPFHYAAKVRGVELFLPALRAFVDAHDDAEVLIVGEGGLREKFEREHAALLDPPGITMYGFCAEMSLVYRACDVYCHFSFFDACPNVMLEAWASGRPVLVNDFPPLVDLMDEGRGGRVINSSAKAEDVAATLEELVYDPDLRARLGEEGRRAVLEKFSYQAVGRRLVNALETVL
jgi:glycosyltransferase involved in cell wall biosynthesis